jgi:hypothetical protein
MSEVRLEGRGMDVFSAMKHHSVLDWRGRYTRIQIISFPLSTHSPTYTHTLYRRFVRLERLERLERQC